MSSFLYNKTKGMGMGGILGWHRGAHRAQLQRWNLLNKYLESRMRYIFIRTPSNWYISYFNRLGTMWSRGQLWVLFAVWFYFFAWVNRDCFLRMLWINHRYSRNSSDSSFICSNCQHSILRPC